MPGADWSPWYRALYDHCARLPGAVGYQRWGETAFRAGRRTFAFLGDPDDPAVTVRPEAPDRRRALQDEHVARAGVIGLLGWVTARVDDQPSLELACDLVDRSYARVAGCLIARRRP
jgi:predicted DNA-binding protein (MmcQ/YjbR family)